MDKNKPMFIYHSSYLFFKFILIDEGIKIEKNYISKISTS